jgi:Fungal specific transcription factor domain
MLAPQTTDPNRSILGILSQLARLTHMQAALPKATDILKSSTFKERAFEERLTAMEQHLNAYMLNAAPAGRLDHAALMRKACCISGSIYTHLQFRDTQPGNAEMQALKERLIHTLINLDTITIEPHRLDTEGPFLLWILFCGGILCVSCDERTFFVDRIASLLLKLGIERWDEVDSILRGYLWTGNLCTGTRRMLWEEIDTVRYGLLSEG